MPFHGTIASDVIFNGSEFPSNTAILFQQSAAPTNWTKVTTYTNHALRIVGGSVSSGGSVPFSTAFANQGVSGSVSTSITGVSGSVGISGSVDQTTLSTGQIPGHSHNGGGYETVYVQGPATGYSSGPGGWNNGSGIAGWYSNSGGLGGGSHNHSVGGVSGSFSFNSGSASGSFTGSAINLAVNYVDAIICTKN